MNYKVLYKVTKPIFNYKKKIKKFDGNYVSFPWILLSWLFGCLFFAIGIVNTFWGNDPEFGVFILLLSLIYFFQVDGILMKIAGLKIPHLNIIKILLGIFILWAALGVGELFGKIALMMVSLS